MPASTRSSHPRRSFAEVTTGSELTGAGRADSTTTSASPGERGATDLLAGLTAAQRRAVTIDAAPLCVLAGAGAGKTRVLTRRIAHRVLTGSADPAHVLVITFTRKAAGELAGRLAQLGLRDEVQAGTFHAVAAAQLRRRWSDRGVTAPALLDRKARLLGPLASTRPGLCGAPLAELAGHIEWAKARLVGPDDFEATVSASRRPLRAPAAEVASLFGRYEDEKRRRGLIDFDDLLALCADAFDTDPAFASAQRWRWRHVFVDEFQDVNPLQHRLLMSWLGAGTDLCVVGDPNQAIYSWNGADPRLLDTVVERWPSAAVVRLDDNHRCSPQIVACAAAVLGDDGGRLRSSRADGPAPALRSYPSDEAEAHGVAGDLRAAHAEGLQWCHMAVLTRTNAQVGILCEVFERAGIPHQAPGRASLLDDQAVAAVLADWRRTPLRPAQMAAADLEAALAAGGDGWPQSVERTDEAEAALSALLGLARSFDRFEGPGTIEGLLAWARAAGGDRPGPEDAVTVCTFHRAKGLEWSAVWVCGMESGLVPIGRIDEPAATAEERRLLYVALTRAAKHLTCSWAETRRFGAKAVPRSPSPWLELIAGPARAAAQAAGTPLPDLLCFPDPIETARQPAILDADAWRSRLEAQRRRLELQRSRPRVATRPGRSREALHVALPLPDRDLLEALRSWRASVARASGVPAHVVLHDRTLEHLAALQPASSDALMAVPGIGPVKAARLGPALLPLFADRKATA